MKLLIHNLPAFALKILTEFAWERDLVRAIGFGLLESGLFVLMSSNACDAVEGSIRNSVITGLCLVIAGLYLISWTIDRSGYAKPMK